MIQKEIEYSEIFDAQEHFRVIMNATARPGSIHSLKEIEIYPPAPLNKAAAYVALALMNKDVACNVQLTNTQEIETYLLLNTGVNFSEVEKANFIICNQNVSVEVIENANEGDPIYPEQSAFIVLQVEEISNAKLNNSIELVLEGPGIEKTQNLYITGAKKQVLDTIWEKNSEYPLGVELILCAANGQIASIPRSSKIINQ